MIFFFLYKKTMFNSWSFYRNISALRVVLNDRTSILSEVKWGIKSKVDCRTFALVEKCNSKTYCPILSTVRSFAKSKKIPLNFPINEQELSELFDVQVLYSDFRKPIDRLRDLFIEQLSLRNSANAIHQIKVKYDGKTFMVHDLAEIGSRSTKLVTLEMETFCNAIPNVMEALKKSPLGLNPTLNGTSITIPIAKVTREHRENLAKGAKKLFNNCKQNLADVQNKYIKKIDDFTKLPKDQNFKLKTQLTALCKKHVAEAENMLHMKEKELLSSD